MVRKILAKGYIYFFLLLMYIPILVLIAYSFSEVSQIGQWDNKLTLNLYVNLFKNKKIMVALGNTLIIAVISALVSTFLGTIGAMGSYYSKKRVRLVLENINQIPVVNAEIVIALSLTFVFVLLGQFIFHDKIFGFWTLLIGHVVLCAPFVYLNVKPKLEQLDPSLYEAALDLGANPRFAMLRVMVPQLLPGIVSGFLLAISLSLDDFIITAFTRGPGLLNGYESIQTLSTFIQGVIKKKSIPLELRSLTTLIFIVVVIVTISITLYNNKMVKKNKKRKGRMY